MWDLLRADSLAHPQDSVLQSVGWGFGNCYLRSLPDYRSHSEKHCLCRVGALGADPGIKFVYKWLIKESLPVETVKKAGGAGQRRGEYTLAYDFR